MKNSTNYVKAQLTANVKPETKEELQQIIQERIRKEGSKCDLNDIDVSAITNMNNLFDYSEFDGNISNWDVSKVTSMRGMFAGSDFDGDLSKWDVSKVTDMTSMFEDTDYTKDISMWNVNRVRRHTNIFRNCPIYYEKDKQPRFNK